MGDPKPPKPEKRLEKRPERVALEAFLGDAPCPPKPSEKRRLATARRCVARFERDTGGPLHLTREQWPGACDALVNADRRRWRAIVADPGMLSRAPAPADGLE